MTAFFAGDSSTAFWKRKKAFSAYAFEDTALALLRDEPGLQARFEAWKAANLQHLTDQDKVLQFIFTHCQRYIEPEWRRYPVVGLL
jgi:hypothetical protein